MSELESNSPLASSRPRRPWRQSIVAFVVGSALAGSASLFFQGNAGANIPPALPPSDPRLEHLLSLTESQRDCDTECLSRLRLEADKVAALEQALANLQAAATESGERAAALESEKTGLAGQIETLEKDKKDVVAQMERQRSELEGKYRQEIANLEEEKRLLAEKANPKAGRLAAERQPPIPAQEEARPVESAQLPVRQARVPAPVRPADATPRPNAKPIRRSSADPSAPQAAGPKWTIIGMTSSTVVVSIPGGKVVALAAGESADGVTVQRIDLDKGMAQTSAGELVYAAKAR